MTGKSQTGLRYFAEKVNRADASTLSGESKDENHFANFVECVRSRKEPNAHVEIGYRSAVAGHMANMSYRKKQRVALESIGLTARK